MLQTPQQEFRPCAIVEVRWLHLVLQEIALRINEQMTLAALHLLGAVIAARSAHLRGLDRLAVDARRTRCGLPTRLPAANSVQIIRAPLYVLPDPVTPVTSMFSFESKMPTWL